MKELRAAIIGLGRQAENDHIPGIQGSMKSELVAICDINPQRSNKWKNELNVNGYNDFIEMMEREDLDFVIATTPHNVYKSLIENAAKNKISVLKEKPFAMNLEEALYFHNLAQDEEIHIMTTLQRRFNPIYNSFFQLRERIGEPVFIEAKYSFFSDSPHEGWRANQLMSGGGCIIDMGYHMVDMIVWYFGLPDKVHAEFSYKPLLREVSNVEDTASIMFSYDNDLHGTLILSRQYPPKIEYIKLLGDNGIVNVERGKIERFSSDGKSIECLIRERSWDVAATDQIDYFCDVLLGKKTNIGSPEYHMQHVSFIDACYKSKSEGRYISPRELLEEVLK